jgi:hypothetical protein
VICAAGFQVALTPSLFTTIRGSWPFSPVVVVDRGHARLEPRLVPAMPFTHTSSSAIGHGSSPEKLLLEPASHASHIR